MPWDMVTSSQAHAVGAPWFVVHSSRTVGSNVPGKGDDCVFSFLAKRGKQRGRETPKRTTRVG